MNPPRPSSFSLNSDSVAPVTPHHSHNLSLPISGDHSSSAAALLSPTIRHRPPLSDPPPSDRASSGLLSTTTRPSHLRPRQPPPSSCALNCASSLDKQLPYISIPFLISEFNADTLSDASIRQPTSPIDSPSIPLSTSRLVPHSSDTLGHHDLLQQLRSAAAVNLFPSSLSRSLSLRCHHPELQPSPST